MMRRATRGRSLVAVPLLLCGTLGGALLPACVGDEPARTEATAGDSGVHPEDGGPGGNEGGVDFDASSSDGAIVTDAGDGAPNCQTVMEGFEAVGWMPTPTWNESSELNGGTFALDGAAHAGTKSLRFKSTKFDSVARLSRLITQQCTFRFDAWVYVLLASGGDGTSLVQVHLGAATIGLGLFDSTLKVSASFGAVPISKPITRGSWTHVVLDYDAITGEVGLTTDARVSAIIPSPAAVTKVSFGILGAADGGGPADDVSFDDVSLAY